jgi:hypothetical protein
VGAAKTKGNKPCICKLKKTGWPWQATGRVEGKQQEMRCRICGETRWVPA